MKFSLLPQETLNVRKSEVDVFMNGKNNLEELVRIMEFWINDIDPKSTTQQKDIHDKIWRESYLALNLSGCSDLQSVRGAILSVNYFFPLLVQRVSTDIKFLTENYKYPTELESPVEKWQHGFDEEDGYNMMYIIMNAIREKITSQNAKNN